MWQNVTDIGEKSNGKRGSKNKKCILATLNLRLDGYLKSDSDEILVYYS